MVRIVLKSLKKTIGFAASILSIKEGRKFLWLSYITIGFAGFNLIPVIPLSYDFGAEIAYPVSEATAGGT